MHSGPDEEGARGAIALGSPLKGGLRD